MFMANLYTLDGIKCGRIAINLSEGSARIFKTTENNKRG